MNDHNSLFLFGARGTGKSTLVQDTFQDDGSCLKINLLTAEDEDRFHRYPDELTQILNSKHYTRVIIDEIQKVPKLLDIVHQNIESHKIQFILTGSSARKLKRGSSNLLAGRAFTYFLFPLTSFETQATFDLDHFLSWGGLPKLLQYDSAEDKNLFLTSYVRTYLKEEIASEQLVRNLDPFRYFLEIAAQSNGKIINSAKIGKDVGVDGKTIREYFNILEDTLTGIVLPPFHRSIRKRQRLAPKFYLFDPGVKRALERTLNVPLVEQTSAFGQAFEHFLVLEVFKLNEYFHKDFRLSYLRTKDDAEIDLILERPGQPDLLVEMKSSTEIREDHVASLEKFVKTWDRPCEGEVWSRDTQTKKINQIQCLPWMTALKKHFERPNLIAP